MTDYLIMLTDIVNKLAEFSQDYFWFILCFIALSTFIINKYISYRSMKRSKDVRSKTEEIRELDKPRENITSISPINVDFTTYPTSETNKFENKVSTDFKRLNEELVYINKQTELILKYGINLSNLYKEYRKREKTITEMMVNLEDVSNNKQ